MTEMSSSVAIGVPGVTSEPGLTSPQSQHAVEWRRDHAVRELRAHDVHARLRASRIARCVSIALAATSCLSASSWLPLQQPLRFLVGRARLLEARELRAARKIDR